MADNRKLSALPSAQTLGSNDLMYVVREGLSSRATLGQFVTFAAATMQPAAANLTALSGLEAIAGRLPYFTGTGAMATAPTSAFGRSLLNLADAAAGRTTLAAAAQADVQTLTDSLALKADAAVSVIGGGLVSGGGALSASRTLTVAEASEPEALAGTAADKAMTPRRTKAVVEAAVDGLQDAIDTLTAGQTASAVIAATWSELSGYDTGARAAGDYGKVVGSDSGTHTDPVAGGTVDNRGIYAWSETPAGWRRIADLDADAAAASAAAAEAAAEALLPPTDYGNAGGTGDRTSAIIVTTSEGLINSIFGETPSNLIDGLVANGSSAAVSFTPGSAAGSYIRFDFGAGAAQRITEARWIQGNADEHGTWKWRASDDLVDYDDIGSAFTLGGLATQLLTELESNTRGYRYYELVGMSGSRSINPYLQEIEFKIAPTSFDRRLLVAAYGNAGDVLTKWSDRSGDYGFQPARRVYPMPTTGLLAEWYFDEGTGERVRNTRSGDGARDIVFDSAFRTTYTSSPEWTRKGLLLQGDMVQTANPLPGARTVATLYRIKYAGGGVILSGGASSGHGVLGQDVSKTYKHWVASGSGVAPLLFDPVSGGAAFRLNRGGWLLIFTEFDAPYNTKLGWGGVHSSTSARAAELEIAWSASWSGQLDGEDRETVFRGVRRLAAERDIYLHWRDCPDFVDCALFWGQSGITGYSLISDLSAEDQTRTQPANSVLVSHAVGPSAEWLMPEPFQFKYNHRAQGLLDSRMGPLPGAAWAHEDERSARRRKLLINQSAQDSTSLALAGAAGPYEPSRTWNVAYLAPNTGMLAGAMRHWWQIEQYLLLQGLGPRPRALWYFQGEEDSIDTVQSAEYGANLAALWNATKTYLATPSDFTMKLVKTPVLTSLAGFDNSANNQVRAAQTTFAAAEPDVELIICDDIPQQNVGWPLDEHFTGRGIKAVGERLYAATNFA